MLQITQRSSRLKLLALQSLQNECVHNNLDLLLEEEYEHKHQTSSQQYFSNWELDGRQ